MSLVLRRRRILVPGAVLLGFSELFDRAYGNPKTPRCKSGSYLKITPTRIGYALLPFACPYCGAVRCDAVDPKRRRNYRDEERGFSWCPACLNRYVLNVEGRPLEEELEPGASCAPALVERDGETEIVGSSEADGLALLGVV